MNIGTIINVNEIYFVLLRSDVYTVDLHYCTVSLSAIILVLNIYSEHMIK